MKYDKQNRGKWKHGDGWVNDPGRQIKMRVWEFTQV